MIIENRINPHQEEHWYKNDKVHRDDGPAIVYSNTQIWYQNGKRHREDGPAYVGPGGLKYWYNNDKLVVLET